MSKIKYFVLDLLNSMGNLLCYGWPIVLLAVVCIYGEYHHKHNLDQHQQSAYEVQAIHDDQIWSLLAQGGGMIENHLDYYELVMPYGADTGRLVAYYKAAMDHPVSDETRVVLEILQTRAVPYFKVYVGDHTRVDEAIRATHPELSLDFNLQNRPSLH